MFFPAQCRGVLRQLLRLLSTRSLYPVHGYLYRQGRLDQRYHRSDAARGHLGPVGTRRYSDRGLGLLHLWPGLAGGLSRHVAVPRRRHDHSARNHSRQAGGDSICPQRRRASARHVSGTRGRDRDFSRGLGFEYHPRGIVRRRGGVDCGNRPPDRPVARALIQGAHLSQEPLRDCAGSLRPGPAGH